MELSEIDHALAVSRFEKSHVNDFSPSSLKEYGRRYLHSIELYHSWRSDPQNFFVKTRAVAQQPADHLKESMLNSRNE